MKVTSWATAWDGGAMVVGDLPIFGHMQVCVGVDEDLPVLRIWDEEDREIVHLTLDPAAAAKLRDQAEAAIQAHEASLRPVGRPLPRTHTPFRRRGRTIGAGYPTIVEDAEPVPE